MTSSIQLRAFVASTRKDLAAHREHVIRVLRDSGLHVDPMENWTADPATPLELSTDRVHACDLCVLLVGHHVGHVPEGHQRSITQQEYDAAIRGGLDVLVFLHGPEPLKEPKTGGRQKTQAEAWRAELLEAHTVAFFGEEPGSVPIAQALSRWLQKAVGRERLALYLPGSPNPNFVGREDLMADLRAEATQSKASPLAQVLAGLGGVGKSEVALQYAHRYKDRYSVVWWARAETSDLAREDLAALANRLGLAPHGELGIAELASLAGVWLQNHSEWLLILDNSVDHAALRTILPAAGGGHALITSRNTNWGRVGTVHHVEPLDRINSVAFLMGGADDADEESAELLSEELGDLPLALEQARGFVDATGIGLREYLELYRKHGARLLRERLGDSPYPHSVGTTWSLSIDRLAGESPDAHGLLHAVSLLAPDPVPLSLFEEPDEGAQGSGNGTGDSPESNPLVLDSLSLLTAQSAIRRYALARVADGTVTMHRLVQAVVRDGLGETRRRTLLRDLVGCLLGLVGGPVPEQDRVGSDALVEHMRHVVTGALGAGMASRELGELLTLYGNELRSRARWADALTTYEAALARLPPSDECDPSTASALLYRAYINAMLHDRSDGLAEIRQVQSMAERIYETAPTEAIAILGSAFRVLRDLGDHPFELEVASRALAMARETLDPGDVSITDFMQMAASAAHATNEPPENRGLLAAKRLHEEAIAISERLKGPGHPSVASNLGCLGDVMKDLGDIDAAIRMREQAMLIWEEHEGPGGLMVAGCRLYLATHFSLAGRHVEAVGAARKAVPILEGYYGTDHPEVKWGHHTLASALWNLGRSERRCGEWDAANETLAQAEQAANAVVHITETAFGPTYPRVAEDLVLVGLILCECGSWEKAQTLAARIIDIAGTDAELHAGTLASGHQLAAMVHSARENYDEALEHLEDALSTLRSAHPDSSRTIRDVIWEISSALFQRASWSEQAGWFEAALRDRESALRRVEEGSDARAVEQVELAAQEDFALVKALCGLAETLILMNDLDRAGTAAERVYAITTSNPEIHPDWTAYAEGLLAEVLAARGDVASSVEMKARSLREETPSGEPCEVQQCRERGLMRIDGASLCAVHWAEQWLGDIAHRRAEAMVAQGRVAEGTELLAGWLREHETTTSYPCLRSGCSEPEMSTSSGYCPTHRAQNQLGFAEDRRAELLAQRGAMDEAREVKAVALVLDSGVASEVCTSEGCAEAALHLDELCPAHRAEAWLKPEDANVKQDGASRAQRDDARTAQLVKNKKEFEGRCRDLEATVGVGQNECIWKGCSRSALQGRAQCAWHEVSAYYHPETGDRSWSS